MKNVIFRRIISVFLLMAFFGFTVMPPSVSYAQGFPSVVTNINLPIAGTMIPLTNSFNPTIIKGLTINPDNPLQFDFIVSTGDMVQEIQSDEAIRKDKLKSESEKLIKYFLAALTVPEDEQWVNLSPYEKNRIVPNSLGETVMGRDMLAQDYILKQLTASLMYPEEELGKKFWDKVYAKAYEMYGTVEIPVNTFNKVWIVPDKAVVFEHEGSGFVVESRLEVLLEEDYENQRRSLDKGGLDSGYYQGAGEKLNPIPLNPDLANIVRQIIIPALEVEVNEGENFAPLRQIYNSMILASWFKQKLFAGVDGQSHLLKQIYVDQNKIKGIDLQDKQIRQKIYDQYIEAFKKGVYDYIKEDIDPKTNEIIPRRYFSGGESTRNPTKNEGRQWLNDIVFYGVMTMSTFGLSTQAVQAKALKSLQGNGGMVKVTAGFDAQIENGLFPFEGGIEDVKYSFLNSPLTKSTIKEGLKKTALYTLMSMAVLGGLKKDVLAGVSEEQRFRLGLEQPQQQDTVLEIMGEPDGVWKPTTFSENAYTTYKLVNRFILDPIAEVFGAQNSMAGRFLLTGLKFPFAVVTTLGVHEFGHISFAEENMKGYSLEFDKGKHLKTPYVGYVTEYSDNTDKILSSIRGINSSQILSNIVREDMFQNGSDYEKALLYLFYSKADFTQYAIRRYKSITPGDLKGPNDFRSYDRRLTEKNNGELGYSPDDLKYLAVSNLMFDFTALESAYKIMRYILYGEREYDLPRYRPYVGAYLSPFGLLSRAGMLIKYGEKDPLVVDLSIDMGKGYRESNGVNLNIDEIKFGTSFLKDFTFGINVKEWKQNGRRGYLFGGSLEYDVLDDISIVLNAFTKTEGFVPGLELREGIFGSMGFKYTLRSPKNKTRHQKEGNSPIIHQWTNLITDVQKDKAFNPVQGAPAVESTVNGIDPVGGIDFNRKTLDLEIKGDGFGVSSPVFEHPLLNMKIDGLSPVIINIVPVNVFTLLGFNDEMIDDIQRASATTCPSDDADSCQDSLIFAKPEEEV